MSAFGAYPAILQQVQAGRLADPTEIGRPRFKWLGWACLMQLVLILLLDLLVFFPGLFR